MQRDMALAILGEVGQSWRTSTDELLSSQPEELQSEWACFPVEGLRLGELLDAVDCVRIDPRWAE